MASQVAVPTGLHASAFYAPLQSFTNGCHVYLWVSSLVTDTKYNFQEGIVILQSGIACGVFCTGHIFPVPSPSRKDIAVIKSCCDHIAQCCLHWAQGFCTASHHLASCSHSPFFAAFLCSASRLIWVGILAAAHAC